jgi:lipoate-protein ligase A
VPPRSHASHHAHLHALLDVEQFRGLTHRHAVVRRMELPTVVLGSTQRAEVVNPAAAAENGVAVVRRRGGGGAVLLQPGDHVWVEAWIPRHDPLWAPDVADSAVWVGAWWQQTLEGLGLGGLTVHRGPAVTGRHGALVCFSGRGPGEVFSGQRKIMGVSQWRSREGSLFHTCAYTRWDPLFLVDLFDVDAGTRDELRRDLPSAALGLAELTAVAPSPADLEESLLASFATWGEGPLHSSG